ncbi:hypothetical protein P7C70_g1787, partial [Phenoliferia sp. Uapishka_3]
MRIRIPWEGETVNQFIDGLGDQFTKREKAWLRASGTSQEKLRRVFAIWTLKEAFAKARGEGVKFDFQRIGFLFGGEGGVGWLDGGFKAFVDDEPLEGWGFRLREFEEGYFVAVAVEGHIADDETDEFMFVQKIGFEEMLAAANGVTR